MNARLRLPTAVILLLTLISSCTDNQPRYVIVTKLETTARRDAQPYESLYKVDSKTGKTWEMNAQNVWVPMITVNHYSLRSAHRYLESIGEDVGTYQQFESVIEKNPERIKKIVETFAEQGIDIKAKEINH